MKRSLSHGEESQALSLGLSNSQVGSRGVRLGLASSFVGPSVRAGTVGRGAHFLLFKWGEFHFLTCGIAWSYWEASLVSSQHCAERH